MSNFVLKGLITKSSCYVSDKEHKLLTSGLFFAVSVILLNIFSLAATNIYEKSQFNGEIIVCNFGARFDVERSICFSLLAASLSLILTVHISFKRILASIILLLAPIYSYYGWYSYTQDYRATAPFEFSVLYSREIDKFIRDIVFFDFLTLILISILLIWQVTILFRIIFRKQEI